MAGCVAGWHAWQRGMHGRGHAWQERRPLKRAVCILLECILVKRKKRRTCEYPVEFGSEFLLGEKSGYDGIRNDRLGVLIQDLSVNP